MEALQVSMDADRGLRVVPKPVTKSITQINTAHKASPPLAINYLRSGLGLGLGINCRYLNHDGSSSYPSGLMLPDPDVAISTHTAHLFGSSVPVGRCTPALEIETH